MGLREGDQRTGQHQRHGPEIGAPEGNCHHVHPPTITGRRVKGNCGNATNQRTESSTGTSAIWPDASSCQATRLAEVHAVRDMSRTLASAAAGLPCAGLASRPTPTWAAHSTFVCSTPSKVAAVGTLIGSDRQLA